VYFLSFLLHRFWIILWIKIFALFPISLLQQLNQSMFWPLFLMESTMECQILHIPLTQWYTLPLNSPYFFSKLSLAYKKASGKKKLIILQPPSKSRMFGFIYSIICILAIVNVSLHVKFSYIIFFHFVSPCTSQVLVAIISILCLFTLSSSHGYVGIWVALATFMSLRALAGFLRW